MHEASAWMICPTCDGGTEAPHGLEGEACHCVWGLVEAAFSAVVPEVARTEPDRVAAQPRKLAHPRPAPREPLTFHAEAPHVSTNEVYVHRSGPARMVSGPVMDKR
ncbi:hypothetical protein F4553_004534 [Allocatelliglobosispora scoriae]|uniref:Uncharacterized protein n=1 Tax=Allocatelliglobosispora scoriae TaxID=643052 RepID=A0A841BTY5_9ACTN|nr:hypothetical protein [Allocatelliglobosispora scoriae]MBB5871155.1 hypothetical protein [Allocatelliglobosispora scoriae]